MEISLIFITNQTKFLIVSLGQPSSSLKVTLGFAIWGVNSLVIGEYQNSSNK